MASPYLILLVEDDHAIQRSVRKGLIELGYRIMTADSLAEARRHWGSEDIALVVLDLGLPDGDGTDFLRDIRSNGSTVPVVILTARDEVNDKVRGLDLGADDYLVKPFAFQELSARIRAHLRRAGAQIGPEITAGDLTIDLVGRSVRRGERVIELTPREFDVLVFLAKSPGQPISRTTLVTEVWKIRSRMTSMDNVIDVLMSRLREKIDENEPIRLIHTVRGLGYMIKPPS